LPLAVRNFAKYSPALFEPEAGAQQDWEIIRGIVASIRGQDVQDPTPRNRLDAMLRAGPYGISLEELEAHPAGMDFGPPEAGRLPERLCTPGKTIECAPRDLVTALSDLPAADEPQPEGQLQLIGRRHVQTNNSWLANSPRLVKGPPRCTLMIHPDDAAARGIDNGAIAQVRSRTGLVRLPAEVTDDMMQGVVSIPHGWGHGLEGIALTTAKANAGVSVNDLTDERVIDPISCNATFSGVPVVVELAPGGREGHVSVTNVGGDI